MSSNAYPISAPTRVLGTGDFIFGQTGAIKAENKQIDNFVITGAGGLITSLDGVSLSNLNIGSTNQVLTVQGGLPVWSTPASQGPVVVLFATGDGGGIAANTSWTTLDGTTSFLSMTATGAATDASFNATTGLFTAPATGIYEVCAHIAFTPNNSAGSVDLTASAPAGRATRQVRVSNGGDTVIYATAREQAPPCSDNPTTVKIENLKLSLSSSDTLHFQVRHDSTANLAVLGNNRDSWISIVRIK